MRQLSGHDASFVYLETPKAHMAGGSLQIYDQSTAPGGRVTFTGILEDLEGRLHLASIFRQKLVRVPMDLDHPYWIDDTEFDLEYHVRHIALPKPGDWRQLCILCARLLARPLDMSKPLWEMYVIEGLDNVDGVPLGSYATLTKTHHAAMDGTSGMQLLERAPRSGASDPAGRTRRRVAAGARADAVRAHGPGLAQQHDAADAARRHDVPGIRRLANAHPSSAGRRGPAPPARRRAVDDLQRQRFASPGLRGPPVPAGRDQAHQDHGARGHGQRCRPDHRRGRAPPIPRGPLGPAARLAGRDVPDLAATEGRRVDQRQSGWRHDRAPGDPHCQPATPPRHRASGDGPVEARSGGRGRQADDRAGAAPARCDAGRRRQIVDGRGAGDGARRPAAVQHCGHEHPGPAASRSTRAVPAWS